tara:strand:- start:681 stop:1358 length:678 start_codon:yes stop_codon:yes gene_type:complete
MKITLKFIIIFFLFINCQKSDKQTDLESKIEKFNELSVLFKIDSITKTQKQVEIYATDTLTMYNDVRHKQKYFLSCALILEKSDLESEIESIDFTVNMPNREDGNIPASIPKKLANDILEYYQEPIFKSKIIELNMLNKKYFKNYLDSRAGDLIHNLNTYLAKRTNHENQWTGLDSYDIIKGYVYNRENGINISKHQELFNGILTDTVYWADKKIGKEVYKVITE